MKHPFTRIASILLAVILLFGMLPATAYAGGDLTIDEAYVFVTYPVAGAHPVLTGLPGYDSDPFTVSAVRFYETNASGYPTGSALPASYTFQANKKYACQVRLIPKEGFEFSKSSTECRVNRYYADCDGVNSDGSATFTAYLTCAPGTVTVTFDPNGSTAPAPAPLQVPIGGCVWDALRNFDLVRMPDQPYEQFWDWSLDPFASAWGNYYDFYTTIEEDLTLYAMWCHCENAVELYAELPAACLYADDCSQVTVTVPARAKYEAQGDWLYVGEGSGAPDFQSPGISDYTWPYAVTKGKTYYSRAIVYMDLAAKLPTVKLNGGKLISTRRLSDYEMEVVYSITIPAGDSLTKAGVYIETPRAGQSANPVVTSLTPGLGMSVLGWYTNQNLTGDEYLGAMQGGKTYYALVRIDGSVNYNIASGTLKLDVFGKNAKLVKMVDLATQEGVPNLVGAVVSVTIPKTYSFTVEVVGGGGKFRSDRDGERWTTIMDFSGVEEGPITLEAKGDPTHMFSMWYDGSSYDILSRDEKYTFNVDHDVYIKASFVRKTPFVDVRAKDYFYEPVLWAIEHEPVITSGVDETHFGPKQTCTRAQIVTFLWKALKEPEYDPIENPFPDVKEGKYYYDAVLWAYANGITGGMADGTFGVNQGCTRAQAMFFLWKSYGSPAPESSSCPFKDVKPDKYYYDAILWAYENGVTSGVDETHFGVSNTCTRAQIITFLYKVYGPKG